MVIATLALHSLWPSACNWLGFVQLSAGELIIDLRQFFSQVSSNLSVAADPPVGFLGFELVIGTTVFSGTVLAFSYLAKRQFESEPQVASFLARYPVSQWTSLPNILPRRLIRARFFLPSRSFIARSFPSKPSYKTYFEFSFLIC